MRFSLYILCFLPAVLCHRQLWSLDEDHVAFHQKRFLKGERTFLHPELRELGANAQLFTVNVDDFQYLKAGMSVSFSVPTSSNVLKRSIVSKNCSLVEGSMTLPKSALDTVDGLQLFSCLPSSLEEFTLVITEEFISGFFIDANNNKWSIDRAFLEDAETYMICDGCVPNTDVESIAAVLDDQIEIIDLGSLRGSLTRASGETDGDARVYRFVTLATPEFSSDATWPFSTSTANVAAIITSIMSRVNGIFARELGIYFQLVDNFSDAICLSTDQSEPCASVVETNSELYNTGVYLDDLGFPVHYYDLGHKFSGTNGGVAVVGCLCRTGYYRAGGSSGGLSWWDMDNYARLLGHEIGHQLSASHSFKDCNGYTISATDSTEAGSGTTLMSYTNACGEDNQLQTVRDEYYTSFTLTKMRTYLEGRTCGETLDISRTLPTLSVASTATVPVGNYIQIVGESTSTVAEGSFFSWDRIDVGAEDFQDDTIGRMRSWPPTERRSRFFPNLHFLNFEQDELAEKLPEIELTWNIRFLERSKFLYEEVDEVSTSILGDFVYTDTQIVFSDVGMLSIDSPSSGSTLSLASALEFTISPGGASEIRAGATVQLLFAASSMEAVDDLGDFDFTDDLFDLTWITVAELEMFTETSSFSISVSADDLGLESSELSSVNGNFMVRVGSAADGDMDTAGVYFFDLISDITFSV